MFTTKSTLTVGMNYGQPAGELKGQAIPKDAVMFAIQSAMEGHGIDCYTVFECKGYWMGQPEDSIRVEVMHNEGHKDVVNAARIIKHMLHQEAVLVTREDIQGDLV